MLEPHSSTIDWCEPNFTHSPFIAETWNTVSSLFIVANGCYHLTQGIKNNWDFRINIYSFFVILVGLGSTLFHGTLTFFGQLWDELPMMWGLLYWHWLLFVLNGQTPTKKFSLFSLLFSLLFSIAHFTYRFVLTFQILFSILVILSFYRVYIASQQNNFSQFWKVYIGFLLLGALFWLFDVHFCHLTGHIGFHALWHVCTALSNQGLVMFAICKFESLSQKRQPVIHWYGPFPYFESFTFKTA